MSSDQPYDALGRILSEGGEIYVGRLLAAGTAPAAISALLATRFPGLSSGQRDTLISMSESMVRAGQTLDALGPEDVASPGDIPTNPQLFGDDPAGRRVREIVEFERPSTGQWYTVYLDLADLISREEARQQMIDYINYIVNNYPGAYNNLADNPDDIGRMRITFGEKAF